ncbi:MAG: UDP-N-acetylmuramate dehydrogenase [Thermodesulfobacteriota bacterium]|nr:UDP-N-acetylmuramate dehydrogenase [Candidatus Dadabacteria bacterium]MCZ6685911.1 UDP-N-acetylmuramate dehydrogenase [Candidatus Dadabacteria bacterium]MCZ6864384.1 UDP-N-acetylmuramate dehydrogenase [Candidatus Dadabacteria bacterium]
MNDLIMEIETIGCTVSCLYPMKKYTWLRVGGLADLVVQPNNSSEFLELLNLLSSSNVPWVVLGEGSNTIVYDKGISGVVISTKKLKKIEIIDGTKVLAESGAILGTILNKTIKAGLTGFEFAAGIPGTVGGGIFMNAGANDGEIKDVVDTVWIWLRGEEIALSRSEIKFEYRKSHLPQGSVITKAIFKLEQGNSSESARSVKDYMTKRNLTQPIKMSNTGSIFKNPPQIAAGQLIEELGLKGFGIGGAKFSDLHANFIVNSGNATARDVLELIETAKREALLQRGIKLETEVRVIGNENN